MAMNACVLLCSLVVILLLVEANAQQWTGQHVCSRQKCLYRTKRVCAYRWWGSCCRYKTIWEAYWVTEYFCCSGYTHSGDYNCNDPICNPKCQNGGNCTSPGKCHCPSTHTGYRCTQAVCSYLSPCFPGKCESGDLCKCDAGFQTDPPSDKANYCLKLQDLGPATNLLLTEMQVRMSYWPRYANPPMELHWILADSTQLAVGKMDVFWTNRRDFNRLETTCTSQYFPPDLPDYPAYVSIAEFGIVGGEIEVWLSKLVHGSGPEMNTMFPSLNKTIPCQESVSSTDPETSVYNCSIVDTNFDRFLEHLDSLKITFTSTGGGYRQLKIPESGQTYNTQTYHGIDRMLAVEFRFDFLLPHHCEATETCSDGQQMLKVPDITRTNPIRIEWEDWVDDDSQMFRYAWEVFPMVKTIDGKLEINPSHVLLPLINQEVMASDYAPQTYRLPGPGMYSVILEAGDNANNTRFVRRLVLYDPDPRITSDPQHGFYVSTASEAAGYKYQTDVNGDINVTWSNHFLNARHEDESLLGEVREYPAQLRDGDTEGAPRYRKSIPRDSNFDDHEGDRTVDAIPNERGIVNFAIQYVKDSTGGKNQPDIPTNTWLDLDLNTSYTLLSDFSLGGADTVTVWVKATDAMGTEVVEKTQVSFDSTKPNVRQGIEFLMNVHVEGIPFSSQFKITTEDSESGIAFIVWTFTLTNNDTAIYRETVPGRRVPECNDFIRCSCTRMGECFVYEQIFSVSNCHMMVEKKLDTAVINVTADITNMAGLVTTVSMLKDDLTKLNGTEAYYPPQNITVKDITTSSVTLTWSFRPPACFGRTGIWVIVNNVKHAVHKDAQDFALTGLSEGTSYTIYMVTDYVGDEQSEPASVKFVTKEGPFPIGAIVGIVIAVLLLAAIIVFIVIFLLWRRGKIFQKENSRANKQLNRVSHAFSNIRKTVRGVGKGDAEAGAFQNNAYKPEVEQGDEIYLYGSMAFNTRQNWQLDESSLTLMENVAEGRFATIYKATWRHSGKQETVAAKMLKAGFNEDDAMKMMAKINFMATQLEDHPHVIKFLGAVTDHPGWGPVLVMEYCETGQMDKWLTQNKAAMSEQVMENLFRFCLGIAKGMQYIASKKIVHKRLAARNILLNFLLEPKVAGFGPQDKESTEGKATRVPAKWAAPEVLQDKTPTEKSDVWSYGIVLWEIFSMGQVPYPGIHAAEIGTQLKNGYRMDKPEFADHTYYELMKECWQYKPAKRPTFSSIHARLSKFFSAGNRQSVDFYYDNNQLHG